ncbi:MAG: restriction endonuclease subunit S [Desulfovibrionaceae bacterium]|nr:restriction endonuclease subunit S [Desulfovibrionaceae bacterium]
MFFKGHLIYSKIRPLLNKVAIAPFNGLCSSDIYPIETILDYRYLKYYMLSQNFLCQILMNTHGVKMPRINQDELSTVMVAFPDKEEQIEIADYLDRACDRINSLKQNLNSSIDLFEDLKNKLIADTVTGKIDVRNVTIPDYEPVTEDMADTTPDSEADEAEEQE